MIITLEDFIAQMQAKYGEVEEQQYTDEEGTEVPAFDNNAEALRKLLKDASNGNDFSVAYAVINYANELQINLTPKA
ncbi:MAG: hypothetical protein ACYDD5_00755 [Sulfuricurvum sp.]